MINSQLEIPNHLKSYIVDQKYSTYTAIDHASWRFIMKISIDFFSKYAHSSYINGLDETGITKEKIPRISNINAKLNNVNWKAVPVRGFLPPTIFMQFQAHSILPIASDMRTLNHLTYTPAPDIVHEAAGHSPIIADKLYSKYLSNYGNAASKAIYSKYDHEVYMAIRDLSDIKEDPDSTLDEITRAEDKLKNSTKNTPFISEAAYLARLNWWTVEYGLVGEINDPKIFGAGLLSSVGESYNAIFGDVTKIPLSLDCINYSYDITEQQPQLFIARDFNHLSEVLNELTENMAFNKGGISSIKKAIDSQSICTFKLDSGVEISGLATDFIGDEKEDFFKFTGPVQISYQGKELKGHNGNYHTDGFSSPLCDNEIIEEINSASENEYLNLNFKSGIKLSGKLNNKLIHNQKPLMASFSNCRVTKEDQILFDPNWGTFDLVCGTSIVSVYGGPADIENYLKFMDLELPNLKKPSYSIGNTQETKSIDKLYKEVRQIREGGWVDEDRIREIIHQIELINSEEWLIRYELMEILLNFKTNESKLYSDLKAQIIKISEKNIDLQQSILRGIKNIEN